ncbi:hypothetical protein WAI453_000918 [Rhynchosporium graminicola]
MLLSAAHSNKRFAEPHEPTRSQKLHPRLQAHSHPLSPDNIASNTFVPRASEDLTISSYNQSTQPNTEMSLASGGALQAAAPTALAIPPPQAKFQRFTTPNNTRSSRRLKKQTERGAELEASKAKKVTNNLITPSSSPPDIASNQIARGSSEDSVVSSKSDQAVRKVSPSGKNMIMLRFQGENVARVFGSGSSATQSVSPTPSDKIDIVASLPVPKKGKATSGVQSPAAKKPTLNATDERASMLVETKPTNHWETETKDDGAQPEPAAAPERRVSKRKKTSSALETPKNEQDNLAVLDDAQAESTVTPKRQVSKSKNASSTLDSSKNRTKRNNTSSTLKTAMNQTESLPTLMSSPSSGEPTPSKTPAKHDLSEETSRPTAAPARRGHGKRTLTTALPGQDKESQFRPAKIQKLSPPDLKPVAVPEPIVTVVDSTPENTELTAWLFAYGKEGCERYMRDKFPGCNFEGYGYGRLANYEFVLHHDAYAKAVPKAGSEIYGSLWKVCEAIRSTLETKALKHGMKYHSIHSIQPVRKDPNFEPGMWNAPLVNHAEPLKCWMGVCETLDSDEEMKAGKLEIKVNFWKRRGLSRVIMEMELAGVPQEYFDRYTRGWVPPPRNPFDTGYFVDRKEKKPKKAKPVSPSSDSQVS